MTEIVTPIVLPPRGGRRYECGPHLTEVFKADESETGARYSISKWCMERGFDGVGAHSHEANDEVFWVVDGHPDVLAGDDWQTVQPGSFLRIPAGVTRDFRNLSDAPARLLDVFIPGGFERDMPAIADWFARNG